MKHLTFGVRTLDCHIPGGMRVGRINDKRVERLRRREQLSVPMKQAKKGRLCPIGGTCVRLWPEHRYRVRFHGLVHHRAKTGRRSGPVHLSNISKAVCIAKRIEIFDFRQPRVAQDFRKCHQSNQATAPETVVPMEPGPMMH